MSKPKNIYSVNEISEYVKKLVEKDKKLRNIWVKGELTNYRKPNRHMYFSLKDKNSIIKCVMFSRANKKLKFKPKEGMKLLVRGEVGVYKKRGQYQIIVEDMKPAGGKGELYIKYLQLKEKLSKKGYFKKNKEIPDFPTNIGIITSTKGAAIRDMIHTIERRFPHVNIKIYPTLVQGKKAKHSLGKALNRMNELDLDVIILSRGGGSWEDLWPFNEEIVAQAIWDSDIPIITGVGHETDYTIADFVADKRAPTPSGAAELVVPNEKDIITILKNKENRLRKLTEKIIDYYRQRLRHLADRPIFKKPKRLIEEQEQLVDDAGERLKRTIKTKIDRWKNEIENKKGRLNALSPYSVLNRGYSMTMKDGELVSSIKNINEDEMVTTVFKDGKINSKVEEIESKNRE